MVRAKRKSYKTLYLQSQDQLAWAAERAVLYLRRYTRLRTLLIPLGQAALSNAQGGDGPIILTALECEGAHAVIESDARFILDAEEQMMVEGTKYAWRARPILCEEQ